MAVKIWSLLLMAIFSVANGGKGKFTIMTNLEKLFHMESEVMGLSDIFLREEYFAHDGDHPHDLKDINLMLVKGKELHGNISNMTDYLSHPINILHLTRRLQTDWPNAMHAIWTSEPCQKWDMPDLKFRIQNIQKNFPTRKDLETVALSIAHIQYTQHFNLDELFQGVISGHRSLEPVTLTDLLDIAWAAYDGGQFLFTTKVSEKILSECKNSKRKEGCEIPKLYKIAAASYFEINKLKEAVEMTDKILEIDPDDRSARRNRNFYEGRRKAQKTKKTENVVDTRNVKFYQTCRGDIKMSAAEMSRLHCRMLPTMNFLVFEKAEYHHNDPPVFEIHSPFRLNQLIRIRNIGEYGYRKQTMGEKYDVPAHTHKPEEGKLYKSFSKRFTRLTGPMTGPVDIGTVEVRQFGMEGMYFRPKHRAKIPSLGAHVGSFFTILNSNFTGGEYVFPKYKLKITPTQGNTLFFFATKSTLNICPVSYGVQWAVVQSLFEIKHKKFCRPHEDDLK